jgi:hypothetical protein
MISWDSMDISIYFCPTNKHFLVMEERALSSRGTETEVEADVLLRCNPVPV